MTEASWQVSVVFVMTLVGVAGFFVWALMRVEAERHERRMWGMAAVLGIVLWLGCTGWVAGTGMLRNFDKLPPPFGLLLLTSTTLTTILAFSRVGTRLIQNLSMAALVGFQAFRMPVEWVLHRLYQEGLAPVQMTYAGMNFDVLSGLTAMVLCVLLWRGRVSSWWLWAWNLMGLGLLLTIVLIAILSAPFPFRVFMNEPANTFVAGVPFVWLPTFLVQAAFFGHLLVFRALRQQQAS